MKKILFSLMMLCGVSSLCHAQKKIKFEYDAAGNLVKRYAQKEIRADFAGQYVLKAFPSPTTGPLRVKVIEGRSGQVVKGNIVIVVHLATALSGYGMEKTVTEADVNFDLSDSYKYPRGVYVVNACIYPKNGSPIVGTLKIEKR